MHRVPTRGASVALLAVAVCVCAPAIARFLSRKVASIADRVAVRRIEESRPGIVHEATEAAQHEIVDRAAAARRARRQHQQDPGGDADTPPAEPA